MQKENEYEMDDKKKKLPRIKPEKNDPVASRRARGDCFPSASTSHTQYFRRRHDLEPQRITTDEFCGLSESLSGSSSTFGCVKKTYTVKGLQKRFLVKELDPIPIDKKWTKSCPPGYGWDMASKLAFLVGHPSVFQQKERLIAHISDYAKTAHQGYRVDCLDHTCLVLDFLVESLHKHPDLRESIAKLLKPMEQAIILLAASDIVTYFDSISSYIGFMGYLLMILVDEDLFNLVEKALLWLLCAPDSARPIDSPRLRTLLAAAAPVLTESIVRMIALSDSPAKMLTYLKLVFVLACDSFNNCVHMMKEGIIENIMYQFNPYFPQRNLPYDDINPVNPEDINIRVGSTHVHLSMTMSLMLVILKTIVDHHIQHPEFSLLQFPCPDDYAQRCFLWVFRYECRARDHKHNRITLTVIASALLRCYGSRLKFLSQSFMPDVLSLAVLSEIPSRDEWMSTVTINTSQKDAHFKKMLIQLGVHFMKVFPYNTCYTTSSHWAVGLLYLIDPGLSYIRPKWSPVLFSELRKVIFQALITVLPICPVELTTNINLVRRVMWYIEWYSESPFDISLLYWSLRLLHIAAFDAAEVNQTTVVNDIFTTHGIIIIIDLCNNLLRQKLPLTKQSQTVLSVAMRLLGCGLRRLDEQVTCEVYPHLVWPASAFKLSRNMLDVILHSMEKNFYIADRWKITLLSFMWEAIIWNPECSSQFIERNGIYNLLDVITMSQSAVQCIALAMICDATRVGNSVGQLVTWRARPSASHAHPALVKQGANISALLAAIFRDECKVNGVVLDLNGVLTDLDNPITCMDVREAFKEVPGMPTILRTPVCLPAADIAGSRLSKTFAILHMLSEDLHYKVKLANEAYGNIELEVEDETTLILCAYYLTMKLNEVWMETRIKSSGYLPHDAEIAEEFLEIGRGWSKEIKRMQEKVIESKKNKECKRESTLIAFLSRVRLNVALDGLREVRCTARSADRKGLTHHALLQEAVNAHHRRTMMSKKLNAPILQTYVPKFDEQNVTGQNLKITSIIPKERVQDRMDYPPSHF